MAAPTHGSATLCPRFAYTFATMELELEHPAEDAESLQACLTHIVASTSQGFLAARRARGLSMLVGEHRSGPRVCMASGIRCPHHCEAGQRPGRACGSVQLVTAHSTCQGVYGTSIPDISRRRARFLLAGQCCAVKTLGTKAQGYLRNMHGASLGFGSRESAVAENVLARNLNAACSSERW